MSELIKKIQKNNCLVYKDAETLEEWKFDQLSTLDIISGEKKLFFVYLDNSIFSVKAFWHFFNSLSRFSTLREDKLLACNLGDNDEEDLTFAGAKP